MDILIASSGELLFSLIHNQKFCCVEMLNVFPIQGCGYLPGSTHSPMAGSQVWAG